MANDTTHEPEWISAHLFYHGDLDTLLVRLVAPLVTELGRSGAAGRWFYLRYWDGGKQLRFRVLPSTADTGRAKEISSLIQQRAEQFFTEHPAPERITAGQYLDLARSLAEWENAPDFSTEMYPNNSVVFLPYRPEHDRYGHGASLAAVEKHFAESSLICLALTNSGIQQSQRDTAAFCLLTQAWFSCEPDPVRLAELLDARRGRAPGPPPTMELGLSADDFAAKFAARREALVGLAEQQRRLAIATATATITNTATTASAAASESATGADAQRKDGSLARWARSVASLRDVLAEEAAAGRFEPPREGWPELPSAAEGGQPAVAVLPVLDTVAHLACNRLGVSIVEEAYLRDMARRAVRCLAEQGS